MHRGKAGLVAQLSRGDANCVTLRRIYPDAPRDRQQMGLIAELKRRNVFRVCAGYAVVGWLLIEIADTVFPHLGLPGWTVTLVIALVILGFPLAAFLAWVFEMTPEGLRRTAEREAGESAATSSAWRRAWWLAAAAIAGIAALLLAREWLAGGDPASPVRVGAQDAASGGDLARLRSIAVLPFDNYSPDPSDAYFANGMTEELTSQLSRITELRVMSRTAVARALEGSRPLTAVAAELDVGSVLEGSVRKASDRVRITTKLVDVRSGQQLWSQDFDRGLSDVFEIQREVALAIVGALRSELTPSEQQRIAAAPTTSVDAYQLYLRDRELMGNVPEENRQAIELLRQALALDPQFAQAWSRLAWRYQWETWHGDPQGPAKAMEYANRAIELDASLADAHRARAAAFLASERITEARGAFARALDLDPDHLPALTDGGLTAATAGDLAEGLLISSRALRTAPNVPNIRWHVGIPMLDMADDRRLEAWLDLAAADRMSFHRLDQLRILLEVERDAPAGVLARLRDAEHRWSEHPEFRAFAADVRVFLGDPGGARAELERLFTTAPDIDGVWATHRSVRTNLAFALQQLGERERAATLYDEALRYNLARIEQGSTVVGRRIDVAAILAVRGDPAAIEWLEKAFDAGYRANRLLARDPMFASLRSDPRFLALQERMAAATARERARVEAEGIAAPIDAMIAAGPSASAAAR